MNRTAVTRPTLLRGLTIAGCVAAASTLAACAAGIRAETAEEHPSVDAAFAHAGSVDLAGLSLAAPSQVAFPPGADVRLHLVLINQGRRPDELLSVRSADFRGWQVSDGPAERTAAPAAAVGEVTVPPGEAVGFDEPDTRRTLTLTGLDRRLYPAAEVRISFTFRHAGTVSVWVPVQLTSGQRHGPAAA